ncbi:MAG: asparaginase [Pyrinomonadaceae bacterium]|nr:asparaginase [Pyrinomonadaceae bacterium]
MNAMNEILIEVWRGETVESIHRGHLMVVNGDGETVCELGEPETVTFLRSSAKPFQTVSFLLSGAAERFGFSMREIALACGSHNGENLHVETSAKMLQKIGLSERDLRCGAHEPFNVEIARELIRRGEKPNQLHNNCSGKHAAMLAFAKQIGANLENYETLENPVQQSILDTIAKFADVPKDTIKLGVDGCAAPNYAVSLRKMAGMFAKLVFPPSDFDVELREACRRVVTAMMDYPEMIGGSVTERLDTIIMHSAKGKIVSKIGAEGVYTAGVLPSPQWKRGLGIALKIADGEDRRARPVAVLEILRQLGILDANNVENLKPFAEIALTNRVGQKVGAVIPNFTLNF